MNPFETWCKEKLALSANFEEGFIAGYEFAKKTIPPEVKYVQHSHHTKDCRINIGGSECSCAKGQY